MKHGSDHGKVIIKHILVASFLGLVVAAAKRYYRQIKSSKAVSVTVSDQDIIPRLERTESGRVGKLERFSHYVARQMGFLDANEFPQLCKLACDYLRKSDECENDIYAYFSKEPEAKSLYRNLISEFETCILSYFAFHWGQASLMISQVLNVESERKTRLKDLVLKATRNQRFERITKDLKVTRVFTTLVEEMKAINGSAAKGDESQCTEVMVPMAHSERSPMLLLMGGGMGAGKSTVLKEILNDSFWLKAKANAVVVEADAFKETDVIYRALSRSTGHHHEMLHTAELVHQSSTNAASSLLVTALNEGRDVIMDGTLSWEPFVEQTIDMARNIHKCRYRMGVGYKVGEDGTITENYWEQVKEGEEEEQPKETRKPYRIELVGMICDPYLAVVRGIRRAIMVGRAVRVNSQLNSHKRFASAFLRYCQLVDKARLFCTNSMGGPPKLIARKDGDNKPLIDPDDINCLTTASNLNAEAQSIYELYSNSSPTSEPSSIWKDIVLSPSRASLQQELRDCIKRIENPVDNKL